MSAGIQHSLRADTSKLSPDECADAILKALF
jgi:chloramphenicol 3-O-phosphotransferase